MFKNIYFIKFLLLNYYEYSIDLVNIHFFFKFLNNLYRIVIH